MCIPERGKNINKYIIYTLKPVKSNHRDGPTGRKKKENNTKHQKVKGLKVTETN